VGDILYPVISPDGTEVAFQQDGQLKVAPLGGGIVRTLAVSDCCPTWGPDGFLYYSTPGGDLSRVPVHGGPVEEVLRTDSVSTDYYGFLQVLPRGEVAIFMKWGATSEENVIEAVRLATGERTVLTPGIKGSVTSTGHLVFATMDGRLLAAPFDSREMRLTGPAIPLIDGVFIDSDAIPYFSLSEEGTLVYLSASGGTVGQMEFTWVTRAGVAQPVDPGYTISLPTNTGWRLSPDETRIAFNSVRDGTTDVRIKHLPDGPEERITFSQDDESRPFWAPDGQHVTYFSGPDIGNFNVWSRRADGTGDPVLVLDDVRSVAQGSWSPDGQWLILRAGATAAMGLGMRDILAFRPGVDSAAVPLVANPQFFEGAPEISPNGRWLAYISNEAGQQEVFVRPFPDVNSTRVRISASGGFGPLWAKSGSELFYVDGTGALVAVRFDPTTGQPQGQQTLFAIPAGFHVQAENNFYDVTADGERFLMVRRFVSDEDDSGDLGYVLVQNFFEELKRLVPN